MRSAQDRSLRRWVSPRRGTRSERGRALGAGCPVRAHEDRAVVAAFDADSPLEALTRPPRGRGTPDGEPLRVLRDVGRWRGLVDEIGAHAIHGAICPLRELRARLPRAPDPRGTEAGRQRGQRGQVSPGSDSWSMDEAEVSLVRPHESPDLQAAGLSARQTLVLRSRSTTPQPGVSFAPWIFS